MKQIPVNGTSITLALTLLVAVIGVTWVVVGLTDQAETRALREQMTASRQSFASQSTEPNRPNRSAADALAAEVKKLSHLRGLKKENETLRKAIEEKDAELASLKTTAAAIPGADHKPGAAPGQTFDLAQGQTAQLIKGILALSVTNLSEKSGDVIYGEYPRTLNVGQSLEIGYLGKRCALTLRNIKEERGTRTATFSFAVL